MTIFNYIYLGVFCLLALKLTRGASLGLLIASLIILPEYVRFDIFIIQMSVARVVAIIILVRWWSRSNITLKKYDHIIIVFWLTYIFMSLLSNADSNTMVYVIGRGLDTVLMYFAARVALTSSQEINDFYKFMLFTALIAAILAILETFSSSSLYTSYRASNEWIWNDKEYEPRLFGLVRAYGASLNPIYWGLSLFVVLILQVSFRSIIDHKKSIIFVIITALGVLSSLSSGPILGLFVYLLLVMFLTTRQRFSILTMFILFLIVVIEIGSNRHFYDMTQYITLNSATAWYRSKLIEVALENYESYIMFGVGGDWPHHWGKLIDGREIVDIVNQFLKVALNGGIVLLVLYLYILVKPIKLFFASWEKESLSISICERHLAFGVLALILCGFTVAFYNPVENLIYILLGCLSQVRVMRLSTKS